MYSRFTAEEWVCTVQEDILCGKSAPSPPAAPDPTAVASAQSAANKDAVTESARVNQVNQISPYGSQTWSGTIGSPDRTVTTSLNPTDQATLDKQRALAGALTGDAANAESRVSQISQTPFDISKAPAMINPDATNLKQVQDAVYGRNTQYLDPQFADQSHELDVKLSNQGIPVGSEAWTRAMDQQDRSKRAAYSDARDAAIQAGNSAQAQQFGLAQTAHQQGISDILTSRTQPMNELATYLQGSPALQGPSFGQPAQYQVAPADVTGAFGLQQSARNVAYQGGVQSAASGNSATAGLAGAAMTAAAIF